MSGKLEIEITPELLQAVEDSDKRMWADGGPDMADLEKFYRDMAVSVITVWEGMRSEVGN